MAVKLGAQTEWLNYHHLHYFYVIAKEGSIAKASQKLNVGQPALSAQLRNLEEALGTPLFDRQKQRLVLTEAGRIALDYAEEVFRLGSEMIDAIHDRRGSDRVQVQIGALDGIPKDFIVEIIQRAYRGGPCAIAVLEGRGDELFRALRAHELDLVISNFPPTAGQSGIFAKPVAKLSVSVYGSVKFKMLKGSFPESLSGMPFVLPTAHSKLRHDLDHFFKLNAIYPDIVAETQDTSIQKLLGAAGIGLLPLPDVAAQPMVKDKVLFKLGSLESVTEEIWFATGTRKIENPVAARLMKEFGH